MASRAALLGKGYLPRELPPGFTSQRFSRYSAAKAWRTNDWTKCVSHNLARPGGLRRPLRIPNPISYCGLADVVSQNWADIHQFTWRERLSASRPFVMSKGPRAIVPRYAQGMLGRLRALRRRSSRLPARYRYRSVLSDSLYPCHSLGPAFESCREVIFEGRPETTRRPPRQSSSTDERGPNAWHSNRP